MPTNTRNNTQSPRLHALLFRHLALLTIVLGMVSVRYGLLSLTGLVLIFWIDSRTWRFSAMLLLCLCFGLGHVFFAQYETQNTPNLPSWAKIDEDNRPQKRHINARISRVQSLHDERLRVFLEDIHVKNQEEYNGELIWTWDKSTSRPLVGQRVEQEYILRPISSFANRGNFSSTDYWHRQEVFLRSWSRKGELNVIDKQAQEGSHIREAWRMKTARMLGLEKTKNLQKPEKTDHKGIKGQASAIVMALLFGDKYYLSQESFDLFRDASLAHSLALSGQHLSVATFLAAVLLTIYTFVHGKFFEHVPRNYLIALLSLPFALFYLWLGSAPPSLLRAATMLCLGAVLLIIEKKGSLLDALCLCFIIMIAFKPDLLFDLSLQLSFSALLSIAFFLPLQKTIWQMTWQRPSNKERHKKSFLARLPRRFLVFVLCLFAVSLSAQLGVLPISLSTFGTQSPYIFFNVLWLPVLSVLVLPAAFLGLFGIMLGFDAFAFFFLHLASLPCEAFLHFLHWCAESGMDALYMPKPSWTTSLAYVCLLLACALYLGRKHLPSPAKRCLLAAALLFLVTPIQLVVDNYKAYSQSTVSVRLLDVGQGQAVLIEWAEKPFALGPSRLLIDGGGFRSGRFNSGSGILAPILTQNRLPHIDNLVLTHPDIDHIQGLIFLAEYFSVGKAYIPTHNNKNLRTLRNILKKEAVPYERISKAKCIKLSPHLFLKLLPPDKMQGNDGLVALLVYKKENNNTNAQENFAIDKGQRRCRGKECPLLLVMGDMSETTQRAWLKKYPAVRSEAIVVPHHGSEADTYLPLYDKTKPDIALVSCSLGNRYGFPSKYLQDNLKKRKISLYSTSTSGEIALTWREGRLVKVYEHKKKKLTRMQAL